MAKRELRVAVSATKTSAFITITGDSRPKPGHLRRPFLSELTMACPFEPFGRTSVRSGEKLQLQHSLKPLRLAMGRSRSRSRDRRRRSPSRRRGRRSPSRRRRSPSRRPGAIRGVSRVRRRRRSPSRRRRSLSKPPGGAKTLGKARRDEANGDGTLVKRRRSSLGAHPFRGRRRVSSMA